jgi:signal transduction histidine kinase
MLVRAVQAALAVEVAAFTVSTLPGVRGESGFEPLIDGWLQGAAYVTAAVLSVLAAVYVRDGRRAWSWVAGAVSMRAVAFVIYLGWVREMDPLPYPSVSDFFWLGMSVLILVAMVSLIQSRFTRVSRPLLLDGVVGALATTGLALALLYGTLVDLTAPGTPTDAVATNLAYPIADVMLLLVMLGMLVAYGWRPPLAIWLLAAGVAAFAVVDSVFLYQVAAGTYEPGTLLASLSLIATSAIAWAGCVRPGSPVPDRSPRPASLPGLVVPAVFGLACVGLLIYASYNEVPAASVYLAAAGLVVGFLRAALTFRDQQALSDELERQAAVVRAARDEAERASRIKTEFLSRMSHELRTPLNSVIGFAQLIELDAPDETQRANAGRILGAGRHLLAMIDDLLDISRVEAGAVRASVEPVPAAEVAREALDMAQPLIAERGLTLEQQLDEGTGRRVLADYRRLRQVLLNLISNAVKYNRDEGTVTVSLASPRPEWLRFEVADTGVGITADDLERLFQPFERLDASEGGARGTGLGLVVSKSLVEEMGGSIGVVSTPGVGTTFHVELPAAPASVSIGRA